jgi:tetratricopeptide (TPR) repeat protein
VLANTRGFTSHTGVVDSERVQALEAAAQALQSGDPRRAQILALLASELHYSGEPSRRRQLAAEAIETARAVGDEAALAHTLSHVTWAITAPDTLEQRQLLADELFDLTQRLDDPRLSFLTAAWRVFTGMEAGNRSQVESAIAVGRAVAASVPHPSLGWAWLVLEAMWSFAQGDLEASEQWAIQAVEAGTAAGEPDALMMFGAQLFAVRYFQGRLGELVERSVQVAGEEDSLAVWRALTALALIESGREDEARELALAENFQSIPWDLAWSSAMILWVMVCSRLGLVDRVGELYEMLAPFSGMLAVAGITVWGTIGWALGTLAATQQRYEEAEGHFAAAAEIERSLGAPLFLARTHAAWARALIVRGRPEDLDRAQPMLEEAHDTATRLGAGGVTREIVECRAALGAVSS